MLNHLIPFIMKAEKKLLLLAVQVRPTFNSRHFEKSVAASRSEDLLDDMSDIVTMPGREVVTLALRFYNKGAHYAVPSGIRRTLTVNLTDGESRKTLRSVDLEVNIPETQDEYRRMIDVPLPEGDDRGNHSYIIEVRGKRSGHVYYEKPLRLFSFTTIRKFPQKWYSVTGGSLGRENPAGADDFVAVIPDGAEMLTSKIRVRLNHEMLRDSLPELCLRTVTTGGCEHVRYAVPAPDPDGGEDDYIVRQSFMMVDGESGITYTEVSCMTHVIGVVPFHTGAANIGGVLTENHIIKTPNPAAEEMEKALRGYVCAVCPERLGDLEPKDELERLLDEFIKSECERRDGGAEDCGEAAGDNGDAAGDDEEKDGEPDCRARLDALVGLAGVKEQVARYTDIVRFNKRRMDAGLPEAPLPKHSMFLGSPGTGKTTVAKIMGEILRQAGVLSSGHVVVCERATLLGQNYSSESENTRDALEKAQGGILFIDEAYQLYQPQDPRDPGKFVIETLLTALADESNRDWMLILAGYTEPMKRMLKMNPGLSSRIPLSNIITFDDYSGDDLMEIARRYFATYKYTLTAGAQERLERNIATAVAHRNESFGNARYVMNLIQTDIIPAMAVRLGKEAAPTASQLSTVVAGDIPLSTVSADVPRRAIGFR